MNIFERATRGKLRFISSVGELTTEQLWDLPLTAKGDRPDLDKMARAVFGELKGLEEGSFVTLTPDPRKSDLELRLEILKHVIDAKLTTKAAAEKAAENAERKRILLAALDRRKEADLAGMTEDQLKEEIAKLDAA